MNPSSCEKTMAPTNEQTADHRKGRRPNLTDLAKQWRDGEKRAVGKIQDRAYRAFATEIVGQMPNGLRGNRDVRDLYEHYGEEILAVTLPPFNDTNEPSEQRALWRQGMIEDGVIVPVQWGKEVYHIQETFLYMLRVTCYMLRVTCVVFEAAWLTHWAAQADGKPPHESWIGKGDDFRERNFYVHLKEQAKKEAQLIKAKLAGGEKLTAFDLLRNPPLSMMNNDSPADSDSSIGQARSSLDENLQANAVSGNPSGGLDGLSEKYEPFHENWGAPPAAPDPNEPFMRDGSHLLASERGRRKIDPVTGKRMIRRMVLTPEAWPHYEWIEDVEGEFGVGPHGPNCSFGMPDDPRLLSPRESWRPYLEKIGRLDLLHKFMPGPNDADQSNPPEPYYCYPKDYTGPRK